MKSRTLLILAASALTTAVAPPLWARPAAVPASRAETPWKAVAASGPVQARAADAPEVAAWLAVSRGDELMPRTLVETGPKGRVTLAHSASLLVVDPSSRLELPGTGRGALDTSIVQTEGSVLYKVDKRSTPHFEVVTPYLVAGVKGTSFLVTVNERYAAVTVQEGRVEITNPGTGESVMLGPGDSVVRQREEIEMELVREGHRSREARKEGARLERMDRRQDERDPAHGQGDAPGQTVKEARGDMQESWAKEASGSGTLGKGGDALGNEIDELTRELNEEMIREEIKDGAIAVPADDAIAVPPGKGGSTEPGQPDPGAKLPDPVP